MAQETNMLGKIVVSRFLPDTLNASDWYYKVIEQNGFHIVGEVVDLSGKPILNRWERPVHRIFFSVDVREVGS